MRLECSVFIGMRRNHGGDCKLGRPSRCFLGIGKSRPVRDEDSIRYHLLVQYQSRKPEKFQINKASVQSVMKAQTKTGRATILLNTPPVNIYVSEADSGKLSVFLRSIEHVVNTNHLDERQILQSWESKSSKSEIATANTRQLTIGKRADYPKSEGFPPALRQLHVNGVGLRSVDVRWFVLAQLTVLDLSANRLGTIIDHVEWRKFEAIRRLRQLEELNLSENLFTSLPRELLRALPESLVSFNLSRNCLTDLPDEICRLKNLRALSLNHNRLRDLPEDLCLLADLRVFSVSDNALTGLPPALFSRLSFGRFRHLDLSNNPLMTRLSATRRRCLPFCFNVPHLVCISAAAFLNAEIPVEDDFLPADLVDQIREWLRRCCKCYKLFPRSQEVNRPAEIIGVEMIRYICDTYSGPSHMQIEQFLCAQCVK